MWSKALAPENNKEKQMTEPPPEGEDRDSNQMGDKEIGWMIITSYSGSLEKQAENAMGKNWSGKG